MIVTTVSKPGSKATPLCCAGDKATLSIHICLHQRCVERNSFQNLSLNNISINSASAKLFGFQNTGNLLFVEEFLLRMVGTCKFKDSWIDKCKGGWGEVVGSA